MDVVKVDQGVSDEVVAAVQAVLDSMEGDTVALAASRLTRESLAGFSARRADGSWVDPMAMLWHAPYWSGMSGITG